MFYNYIYTSHIVTAFLQVYFINSIQKDIYIQGRDIGVMYRQLQDQIKKQVEKVEMPRL